MEFFDRKKVEKLIEENRQVHSINFELERERDAIKKYAQKEIDKLKDENIELKDKNEGILNYLKAILYNCSNNELEITEADVEEAKRHTLYVEDAFMKHAKKFKLFKAEKIIGEVSK